MKNRSVELFPHLTYEVVSDITGFKLCSYLVALEGWRRGLKLKWYKDETDLCKLDKLKSSTQGKFFSMSSNKNTHYFFRSRGDKVSNKSVRICQNKEKTKEILLKNGISVPRGKVFDVNDYDGIINYVFDICFPVIIKPLNGSMGKGVYINIQNEEDLKGALNDFRTNYSYSEFIVEKYYPGKEYRIYVVGDRVVGATNRIPANVIGDGVSTISTLIEIKNNERKKNPYLSPKPIKVDYEVINSLKRAGHAVNSIPAKDDTIYLREKSNLSTGGDPLEATGELSTEIKQLAVDTLKALPSISHAGVDIIVDPESHKKGVVLEVNATAEIGFHLFPLEGRAKDVPGAIIDYYFPETIGKEKSDSYFDFKSVLEPLKNWAAEEVQVANPHFGLIFGKKYVVSGKLQNVGYMNWIRRQALQSNLYGHAKKLKNSKVEIVILGSSEKDVNDFGDLCYQGSKNSKVESVVNGSLDSDQPFKLGFDIITIKS